jgi:hypothetical protein
MPTIIDFFEKAQERKQEMPPVMKKTRNGNIVRLLLIIFLIAGATASEEWKSGMLFGDDHSFYFTAPDGWILDNKSGVKQGLHMVFYPEGETWANSPVIAYGRSARKDEKIKSIKDKVEQIVKDFHDNDCPDYKAKEQKAIQTNSGKSAEIYFFEGDKWGNYEAVGYIEEKSVINFLVYNSREKKIFEKNLKAFYSIVKSYRNVYLEDEKSDYDSFFNDLVTKAKEDVSTDEGKNYEVEISKALGQKMADFMKECSSYSNEVEFKFEAIFRVSPEGKLLEGFVRPKEAIPLCFKGALMSTTFPKHEFKEFLFHINMKVK